MVNGSGQFGILRWKTGFVKMSVVVWTSYSEGYNLQASVGMLS